MARLKLLERLLLIWGGGVGRAKHGTLNSLYHLQCPTWSTQLLTGAEALPATKGKARKRGCLPTQL